MCVTMLLRRLQLSLDEMKRSERSEPGVMRRPPFIAVSTTTELDSSNGNRHSNKRTSINCFTCDLVLRRTGQLARKLSRGFNMHRLPRYTSFGKLGSRGAITTGGSAIFDVWWHFD
jgi:hypothetical protein